MGSVIRTRAALSGLLLLCSSTKITLAGQIVCKQLLLQQIRGHYAERYTWQYSHISSLFDEQVVPHTYTINALLSQNRTMLPHMHDIYGCFYSTQSPPTMLTHRRETCRLQGRRWFYFCLFLGSNIHSCTKKKKKTYQAQNIWENTEEKMSFNTEYCSRFAAVTISLQCHLMWFSLDHRAKKNQTKMLERCALQMKNWHWTADSGDLLWWPFTKMPHSL